MGSLQKYYSFDGFEQVLKIHVLGHDGILHATKPKSKKQQPWITTNANNAWQATLHAICMRKVVSMCTQVYGHVWVHLFMDECLHTQSQACAHVHIHTCDRF